MFDLEGGLIALFNLTLIQKPKTTEIEGLWCKIEKQNYLAVEKNKIQKDDVAGF